jgi:hypothetical protein
MSHCPEFGPSESKLKVVGNFLLLFMAPFVPSPFLLCHCPISIRSNSVKEGARNGLIYSPVLSLEA